MLRARGKYLLIVLSAIIFAMAYVQIAYAHDEPQHRTDLEGVLFGDTTPGNRDAVEHLEEAMYLCLDFNSGESKGDQYLRSLGEYGVANLPTSEEINLPGGSFHQKYTHRGWDAQSQYLNDDEKLKWEKRKDILINTSYKVFDYSPPPGFLSWTSLSDKDE